MISLLQKLANILSRFLKLQLVDAVMDTLEYASSLPYDRDHNQDC